MQLNQAFMLPAVLGTEAATGQNQDHRILALQLGQLSPFRRMSESS